MPRDGFSKAVVRDLADRAGYLCAKCKCLTVGPNTGPADTVMVGVAAHIRAASPGGARYDAGMTSSQRKDISNGIWLCQNDAKLIDDDKSTFTVATLVRMKAEHEAEIRERVAAGQAAKTRLSDHEILEALSAALDRPAMSEPFSNCRQPDFQKAVSDMIEVLNTGVHRLRDGTEVKRIPSRHELRDKTAQSTLAEIVRTLGELRALHAQLVDEGKLKPCGCTQASGAAASLDELRSKVLESFRTIHPTFSVRLAQLS